MSCSPVDPCGACDFCQRERGRRDIETVVRYIEDENPDMDRFFTLTFDPADLDAADLLDDYQAQLGHAVAAVDDMMAELNPAAEWVVGHEPQPGTGNCHLHGLVDDYIPVSDLRTEWMDRGGGQNVHIERVDDVAACADYLLAYCGDVAAASESVPI